MGARSTPAAVADGFFKMPRLATPPRHAKVACLALAMTLVLSRPGAADVSLPLLFSDHMVLQRDMPIPIWGQASPRESVTVTFGDLHAATTADADGKWRVNLDKSPADAEPRKLIISGHNTVVLDDVLVGDVWVGSGQSNIEFSLSGASNADTEIPKAQDPELRLFTVAMRTSLQPEPDITINGHQQWRACTPDAAAHFSAVAYFFARELRKNLNIPIGVISSVQGGSKAQVWTSLEAIQQDRDAAPEFNVWLTKRQQLIADYPHRLAAFTPAKAKFDQDTKRWWNEVGNSPDFLARTKAWEQTDQKALEAGTPRPKRPEPPEPRPVEPESPDGGRYSDFMVGNLYNGMIAPLMPYAIKGVTWYQGEANDSETRPFRVLVPLMITDWRKHWGEGDFPFLFVQLPNIDKPATEPVQENDHWPGTRDAQALGLTLPSTGMAVTIDVGDPGNVHGKDKIDVGQRLALVARHVVYGEDIIWTGPTYDSMKVDGNRIVLTFKNIGGGMMIGTPPWTPSGKIPPVASKLKGFAIAGADRKWAWATAEIQGDQVVVSSELVPDPVAVRYGWANNPPCNLYNSAKLPAAPFRTDDWEQ